MMKMHKVRRFFLILLLGIGTPVVQAQVHLATWEYWIDRQYENHQAVSIDGSLTHEIDVSGLRNGIHTLEMRVSDSNGRWGSTQLRYFLKTDAVLANSHLNRYEYWIDDNPNVYAGTMSGESLQLDIDVSSLGKGVHRLVYQVQYDTGRKSSPRLVYFIVPDLEPGAGVIAAYAYWFNHGSRTRVELQPASPALTLSDMVIEVKDVLPNSLTGYRFDAAAEQVTVDDHVFFGIQVYNADDRGSVAVSTETFPMTVPVDLNMKTLSKNGEPLTVAAPTAGRMQGMKSETVAGDSLFYTLSLENVTADFYDAEGNLLKAVREVSETGEATYALEATTACTYMLVYGASEVQTELTAALLARNVAGVGPVWTDDATEVARYNMSGQSVGARQRGVHIVRMNDGTVRKVVVK